MCACSVRMCFAAAFYALSMEENVLSCVPTHVLDNKPLVPLLENIKMGMFQKRVQWCII